MKPKILPLALVLLTVTVAGVDAVTIGVFKCKVFAAGGIRSSGFPNPLPISDYVTSR